MAQTPHFVVPFTVQNGEAQEVEQDSPEEVAQCVEAVLRTPEGTRIDEPEFGRPDETFVQLFSADSSATQYVAAVERWEPRASVLGEAEVEGMAKRVIIEERSA